MTPPRVVAADADVEVRQRQFVPGRQRVRVVATGHAVADGHRILQLDQGVLVALDLPVSEGKSNPSIQRPGMFGAELPFTGGDVAATRRAGLGSYAPHVSRRRQLRIHIRSSSRQRAAIAGRQTIGSMTPPSQPQPPSAAPGPQVRRGVSSALNRAGLITDRASPPPGRALFALAARAGGDGGGPQGRDEGGDRAGLGGEGGVHAVGVALRGDQASYFAAGTRGAGLRGGGLRGCGGGVCLPRPALGARDGMCQATRE
jgi:hypothetical protein